MITAETGFAISHNYAIYARALDEKRFELLTDVFADDATLGYFVAGHDFTCSGREAADAFGAFLQRCYWTHHLIAHPMVEAGGRGVLASARVTATHIQHRDDGTVNRWLVRGSYHDEFEQRGERWLIVDRKVYCYDAEGDFVKDGVQTFAAPPWRGSA